MNEDARKQAKQAGKTVGVVGIAAALVYGVSLLVLPPTKPKLIVLRWDHIEPQNCIFEIVSKTNIQAPWIFRTNVVGTNAVAFERNQVQEFFTISKVMDRNNTNVAIRQKGF